MNLWNELGLDMDRHRVVTLVGAGGKTSTMYRLAWEARRAGRRVIITTSTHIRPHPRIYLTADADPAHLRQCLDRYGILTLGRRERGSVSCDGAALTACRSAADVVLVEGDGARLLPLKVPAPWEPVILPGTDAIVALAGMDALGQPMDQVVHRCALACRLLNKPATALVTEDDVADILSSPQGARKAVPREMDYRCVLNKAEGPVRAAQAADIRVKLERRGIRSAATFFCPACRGGNAWF